MKFDGEKLLLSSFCEMLYTNAIGFLGDIFDSPRTRGKLIFINLNCELGVSGWFSGCYPIQAHEMKSCRKNTN